MMIPPIVGVPAFAWWPSGPSSRMLWPNSRSRRNAMNFGDRKTQISSEAVPAIRTSPMRQRLRDRLQADPARRLHQHHVARTHEPRRPATPPRRRRSPRAPRRRTPPASPPTAARRRPARRPRTAAAYAPISRCASSSPAPELEHVSEHGDTPPPVGRLRGEIVERGAHGQRVGVVAVIDDEDPRGQRDVLARASPRTTPRRARTAPRRPPGPPRPRPAGSRAGDAP